MDAIALPSVQGRLTNRNLTAIVESQCAHCAEPIRVELTSELAYRVLSAGATPVVSSPLVDLRGLKDPSIIHAF